MRFAYTSIVDYADLALAQELEENPDWSGLICDAFVKLSQGFWDDEYVSIIMDRWGGTMTFGDVYCFIQVHSMLASGRALRTAIEVWETPLGDRFTAENNAVLRTLPRPFSGRFKGGGGDNDGHVSWSEPIRASEKLFEGGDKKVQIDPGQAPLEVGYTNAQTTLLHLKESHAVARWPYDSSRITIIHLVEPQHPGPLFDGTFLGGTVEPEGIDDA